MAAATMDRLRQLYGQPRDAYAGTTPPVVATPRDPARLLHYCVAGDVVLATIGVPADPNPAAATGRPGCGHARWRGQVPTGRRAIRRAGPGCPCGFHELSA